MLRWGQSCPDIFSIHKPSRDGYEVPKCIDEECFPVHDRYMDQLRDTVLGKISTTQEKMRMRRVLTNDCTAEFNNFLDKTVLQKRRVVIYVYGGAGLGKSIVGITINLRGREKFIEYLGLTPELVYPQSFPEVSTAVKEAESKQAIYFMLQDEDSEVGGSGSASSLADYTNCITNLRFRRHWFIITCPKFNPQLNGLFDCIIRVIGYNEKLGNGTNSFILYYPDGTEQGYVLLNKYKFNADSPFQKFIEYRNEYDYYETSIKAPHQHDISGSGGAVIVGGSTEMISKGMKIARKMLELRPNSERFTEKVFGAAARECGESVVTRGDYRAHLLMKTEDAYNKLLQEKTRSPPPPIPVTQPQQQQPTKSVKPIDRRMNKATASEYSNQGHDAEDSNWDKVIPELFRGTGAKVIRVGGYGKEDGIIDYKDVTYICDSKDYTFPLDQLTGHVANWKLNGCINRYRIERERGNANVYVTVICHEKLRNMWAVKLVADPLSIPVDSRGRYKESQKIDLTKLKPTLSLEDFGGAQTLTYSPQPA